ncbi:hypothetical protein K432DRAFT_416276 [Lepidopterella palustris CBS 459.81]|uniref:WSC domain-containing protein n=1 Tax=Lepidopterella palustris CBS 459.81 TaxID=1314670 RepID=A0A8E2JFY5_9PEZI|nr:hypothetical protein K432DRAFT_416276 [Lepidopterella palustris CBS 459.81]
MHDSTYLFSVLFAVLTLMSALLFQRASGTTDTLSQEYCSSENTGEENGYSAAFWTWQSNGWCHDHCLSGYAFAIVQDNNCWCSNYIPNNQQPVSDCSDACPGYPAELCGSKSGNLFGYIALSKAPSGTQSAAASTIAPVSTPTKSSSVLPPSSAADPETVFKTVTALPSVFTSVITPTSASTTVTPATLSTSQSRSSTWVATPITSVQTLTISGAVVTQIVTTMPTSPTQMQETPKKGSSGGAIAGTVVGSLAGISLIGALLFWLLFYRHRRNKGAEDSEATPKAAPRRNTSTLSRTGLLKSEKDPYPPVVTSVKRNSSNALDNAESISPISERRNSRPLFYDQRLNPTALMEMDNGSHASIITIEDNRDYTRTLNVRNPDPPAP